MLGSSWSTGVFESKQPILGISYLAASWTIADNEPIWSDDCSRCKAAGQNKASYVHLKKQSMLPRSSMLNAMPASMARQYGFDITTWACLGCAP